MFNTMSDAGQVTRLLNSLDRGDAHAAEDLLPLVYQELRRLASQRLEKERPGQTLQATALVHEAYLRLVDVEHQQRWNSRGHFFAAAAEAMRRILVENARRKHSLKRGGAVAQVELNDEVEVVAAEASDDLLALDEALERLDAKDPHAAALVKLRYFAGLTVPEAAEAMDVSQRTAERLWTFAKAWLYRELHPE
jgi:RNA polymerase sigma factor (TIGR02999 family)